MQEIVNKKLVFESFEGKATSLQKKMIDAWVKESDNEELFYQWLQEWEALHLQYAVEKDAALARYQHYLMKHEHNIQDFSDTQDRVIPLLRISTRWMSLAAASVLVCFIFWKKQHSVLNYSYNTGFNQKKIIRLGDGSTIALNANSILWVPRFQFGSDKRLVKLEGEALFLVKHTLDNQKFVVETTNGEEVVVLGTEFNLFARKRGTKIVLQKGKVQVNYRKHDHGTGQVTMSPGDLVAVTRDGIASIKPVSQPANSSEWLNNRYVFEESSLLEISHLFKDNFGMNIKISNPETAALTLSGAYASESAGELLKVVAEALNLQITITNDNVILLSEGAVL